MAKAVACKVDCQSKSTQVEVIRPSVIFEGESLEPTKQIQARRLSNLIAVTVSQNDMEGGGRPHDNKMQGYIFSNRASDLF